MTSLASRINSLEKLGSLEDLLKSPKAQAKITRWGGRIVEVGGFTGSVDLSDLAKITLRTSRRVCDTGIYTSRERVAGLEIVKTLQKFYRATDVEIQKADRITRFFNWIREYFFNVRPYIMDGKGPNSETAEKNFRAYSMSEFTQKFGPLNPFGPLNANAFGPLNAKDDPKSGGYTNFALEDCMFLNVQEQSLIGKIMGKMPMAPYGRVIPDAQRLYAKEESIRNLLEQEVKG